MHAINSMLYIDEQFNLQHTEKWSQKLHILEVLIIGLVACMDTGMGVAYPTQSFMAPFPHQFHVRLAAFLNWFLLAAAAITSICCIWRGYIHRMKAGNCRTSGRMNVLITDVLSSKIIIQGLHFTDQCINHKLVLVTFEGYSVEREEKYMQVKSKQICSYIWCLFSPRCNGPTNKIVVIPIFSCCTQHVVHSPGFSL